MKRKAFFLLMALALAVGLALPMALPALAGDPIPDLPATMPPGTGIFGTTYAIHDTSGDAISGYHWDDLTTPLVDERVDPMHYYWASDPAKATTPPGPPSLNPFECGDDLDFYWVFVGNTGNYAIWDFGEGTEVCGVRVYPVQDHPAASFVNEAREFDLLGSNDATADFALWQGGVETALYYGTLNPVVTHDGVRDFSFDGKFRYVAVRTNSSGGGDFEIDALEALPCTPKVDKRIVAGPTEVTVGQEVCWTFLYTISNPYGYHISNVRITDNFGANLNVAVASGPSQGTATVDLRGSGKSKQYRLTWNVGALDPGESATLSLSVCTGKNPASKQEFTSPGWHVLNSGATAKWINDDTGIQESQVSGTIEVLAHPEGVVLFQDCFEQGLANWSPVSGTWTTESDAIHGTVYAETQAFDNSFSLGAIAGSSAWTNYTFEVWVKALYGSAEGVGPSYRVQTASPYNQYVVQILRPGTSTLEVWKGPSPSWQQIVSVPTPSIVTGEWYRIVIDVNGLNHVVDVFDSANNNVGHVAFTDSQYGSGAIGLNAAAHSQFDCVTVTAN